MHRAFIPFAESLLPEGTPRNLYRRMVRLAAIDHRYSFIKPIVTGDGTVQDADEMFVPGRFPSTAQRMEAFRQFAPQLARCALLKLALTDSERQGVTHVIVTCCTGRSAPDAKVLLLSLELCSLHMQETQELEQLLAFTVFADGCAAYLVTAEPSGFAIDSFLAVNLAGTSQLITWRIGEQGFDMHLSGQVPGQLRNGIAKAGT